MQGYRLGFGMGYYDRFLTQTRAFRLALSFELQLVSALEPEAHDVPMDAIVTEKQTLVFKRPTSQPKSL